MAPVSNPPPSRRSFGGRIALVAVLGTLLIAAGLLFRKPAVPESPAPEIVAAGLPRLLDRSNLVLTAGRLFAHGETGAFTGLMVEYHASGTLLSRSMVSNGWLQGWSEGWYTNGVRQVAEHFEQGVADGLRTKWHPNGTKRSEAVIVKGELHGPFRRWHDNGQLAEEVEFMAGQPVGTSRAYFPSGFLKARVELAAGQPVNREYWQDGELRE